MYNGLPQYIHRDPANIIDIILCHHVCTISGQPMPSAAHKKKRKKEKEKKELLVGLKVDDFVLTPPIYIYMYIYDCSFSHYSIVILMIVLEESSIC